MTGLTETDIKRLIAGLILTRKENADPERKTADAEQETRVMTVLRDESDTRMLLDVARGDIKKLEQEIWMLAVVRSYNRSFIKP